MNKGKIVLRSLAALLAVGMTGGVLTACGGDTGGTSTTDSTTAAETTAAETTAADGDSAAAAAEGTGELCEADAAYVNAQFEKIKPEDMAIFTPHDLGGIELTALNTGVDPEGESLQAEDKAEEKAEVQANLDRIQAKYNVKIKFTKVSAEWDDIPNELVKSIASGQPLADMFGGYRVWLPQLVANDALVDTTEALKDSTYAAKYKETSTWLNKNWGVGTGVGGEGLLYNRKMIKDVGMEKTPTEMFMEGKWSFDDFYNYCVELKSKLKADEYPLYIDPYYWVLYTTASNGIQIVDGEGKLHFTDDAFVESMEALQKLKDANLLRPSNVNAEGKADYWTTPSETFDAGKEVAMTHRAAWQADGLKGKVDFGMVGYPWGANVTVTPNAEDPSQTYKSLSDSYASTYFDGMCKWFVKGAEQKGKLSDIMDMWLDWDNQAFMVKDYNTLAAGGELVNKDAGKPRWFNDEKDIEVYDFLLTRERFEPAASVSSIAETNKVVRNIFDNNLAIRSTLEAEVQASQAEMQKAGYCN